LQTLRNANVDGNSFEVYHHLWEQDELHETITADEVEWTVRHWSDAYRRESFVALDISQRFEYVIGNDFHE
jgi:hypothetical protein